MTTFYLIDEIKFFSSHIFFLIIILWVDNIFFNIFFVLNYFFFVIYNFFFVPFLILILPEIILYIWFNLYFFLYDRTTNIFWSMHFIFTTGGNLNEWEVWEYGGSVQTRMGSYSAWKLQFCINEFIINQNNIFSCGMGLNWIKIAYAVLLSVSYLSKEWKLFKYTNYSKNFKISLACMAEWFRTLVTNYCNTDSAIMGSRLSRGKKISIVLFRNVSTG